MTAEPLPFEEPRPRLAALRQKAQAEREALAAAIVAGQLPARVDLVLYQGDDFFLDISVAVGLDPLDLTGYTPKAEIRSAPGATAIMAAFTATITGLNIVSLHLPHTESVKLLSTASWDCQIADAAGIVTTIAMGSVTITREVTTS